MEVRCVRPNLGSHHLGQPGWALGSESLKDEWGAHNEPVKFAKTE